MRVTSLSRAELSGGRSLIFDDFKQNTMSLPGLLIEYLINGCISSIWLSKFQTAKAITTLTNDEKLLLIPIAYVLGMFIDLLAWFLTYPLKKIIRKSALRVVKKEMDDHKESIEIDKYKSFWNERVEIEKSHSDLNKELKSRSSRDRIARGTMLNLIPISILYWSDLHWVGIVLLIGSVLMWMWFEHYNRCFEVRAAISIRENKRNAQYP